VSVWELTKWWIEHGEWATCALLFGSAALVIGISIGIAAEKRRKVE